jgi:hypothetical protein
MDGDLYPVLAALLTTVLALAVGLWSWHAEMEYVRQYRETRGLTGEETWWRHLENPIVGQRAIRAQLSEFGSIARERQRDQMLERPRRRAVLGRRMRRVIVYLSVPLVLMISQMSR